jgi:hypothetical protein
MMRFRVAAGALALGVTMAAGDASALTFLELATGDDALFPDARSVAMGRTRLSEDAGAFTGMANPARLAWIGDPRVSLGGGLLKLKETRSIPAYDSFDAFLVESIYVLNDEYQYRGGVGATAAAPAAWNVGALGVGVSFAPERDFQYDYTEEVRDNNSFTQPRDQLVALNEVHSSGALDALTFAAGFAPDERLAVGASIAVLSGGQDLVHHTWFAQADSLLHSTVEVDGFSGTRFGLGLSARPDHRLDAGVTWRAEATVDGDLVLTGDPAGPAYFSAPGSAGSTVEITYPQEVGVGLAYRPRAKVRTTVRAEATWTEWSGFSHGYWPDLALHDVWQLRFGLEHVFYNGFPVRFGFHWQPSPQDDEVATTTFTLGGGLDIGPVRADLGFEAATRDYRFDDLFDDAMFGGTSRSAKDLVEESSVTAHGTLTWVLPGWGS